MRQFYETYSDLEIRPSVTVQKKGDSLPAIKNDIPPIGSLVAIQLEAFYSISFTHHILLLNRCKKIEERFFYIENAATQFWSVTIMGHQIDVNLFQKAIGELYALQELYLITVAGNCRPKHNVCG